MYEAMCAPARPDHRTAVLATGDGNGWRRARGFSTVLGTAASFRHRIEVVSWQRQETAHLGEVADQSGGAVELLHDSYYGITFVEGGRPSQPIVTWPRAVKPPAQPLRPAA